MGATEFYIRRPNKENFNKDDIETNDMLEIFLQQIEMVLATPPTSVLGSPKFGVSLRSYLYDLTTSESDLENAVNVQIRNNCTLSGDFSWKVQVKYYKVGTNDSAIIDIIVEDDNLVQIVANG